MPGEFLSSGIFSRVENLGRRRSVGAAKFPLQSIPSFRATGRTEAIFRRRGVCSDGRSVAIASTEPRRSPRRQRCQHGCARCWVRPDATAFSRARKPPLTLYLDTSSLVKLYVEDRLRRRARVGDRIRGRVNVDCGLRRDPRGADALAPVWSSPLTISAILSKSFGTPRPASCYGRALLKGTSALV